MAIIVTPGSSSGDLADMLSTLQALGYGNDTETQQISFLNMAYRDVIGLRRWWFLEVARDDSITLQQNSDTVNLATIDDFLHFEAARLHDGNAYVQPEYLRYQQWHSLSHETSQYRASPSYYTRNNNRLYFWPVADRNYTVVVDYIKDPGQLVNPTDAVVIPETYRDVVVWGAVMRMSFRQREVEEHQLASSRYQSILEKMAEQDVLRHRQTSSQVVSSGEMDGVNNYLEPGGYVL